AFIEANPRLQVEHTVTEEVTGVDLVKLQLELAAGCSLAELGVDRPDRSEPRGFAVQVRVNTETIAPDGSVRPAGGTLSAFDLPSGPGVRVDTAGHVGYRTNPRFDSLLAKVVGHGTSGSFAEALARAARALAELRIEGVATNSAFLRRLLARPEVVANRVHTGFVMEHAAELAGLDDGSGGASSSAALAGAKVDPTDPLAVLVHGKSGAVRSATLALAAEGSAEVVAPMQGTIVSIDVREGEVVYAGAQLLVMEAMKMEHVVRASVGGVVRQVLVHVGDAVLEESPLVVIDESTDETAGAAAAEEVDLDEVRGDLAEAMRRQELTRDAARPDAVARRRATGQRTARENVADLCDPGSFVEYGALAIAAQRRRRPVEELIARTPADGLVAGIGRVNGDTVGEERARCMVMSYDYTVL